MSSYSFNPGTAEKRALSVVLDCVDTCMKEAIDTYGKYDEHNRATCRFATADFDAFMGVFCECLGIKAVKSDSVADLPKDAVLAFFDSLSKFTLDVFGDIISWMYGSDVGLKGFVRDITNEFVGNDSYSGIIMEFKDRMASKRSSFVSAYDAHEFTHKQITEMVANGSLPVREECRTGASTPAAQCAGDGTNGKSTGRMLKHVLWMVHCSVSNTFIDKALDTAAFEFMMDVLDFSLSPFTCKFGEQEEDVEYDGSNLSTLLTMYDDVVSFDRLRWERLMETCDSSCLNGSSTESSFVRHSISVGVESFNRFIDKGLMDTLREGFSDYRREIVNKYISTVPDWHSQLRVLVDSYGYDSVVNALASMKDSTE